MEHHITVIIAEDIKAYRDAIRTELCKEIFTVIGEAKNGLELLNLLESDRPDVVILDIKMPEMDGNRAMTAILEKYPGTKILMLSSYDDQLLMDDYLIRGARGYLSKVYLDELPGALVVINEGRIYKYHRKTIRKSVSIRHKEILTNVSEGLSQEDSAKELGITRNGVARAEKKVRKIFGAASREQLKKIASELGFGFLGRPRNKGSGDG